MTNALINPLALLGLFRRQQSGGPSLSERFWAWRDKEVAFYKALAELEQIDDREAADLGVNGADFPFMAREHARRVMRERLIK